MNSYSKLSHSYRTRFSSLLIFSVLLSLIASPMSALAAPAVLQERVPLETASVNAEAVLARPETVISGAGVERAREKPAEASFAATGVGANIESNGKTIQSAPMANLSAPAFNSGTGVITITKSVVGSSNSGPFTVTVSGPNSYFTTTTVMSTGVTTLTSLASGVYTITEVSPGTGWTTTYTATPGYSTGGSAVVTLTTTSSTVAAFIANITGTVFGDMNSDGLITANGTFTEAGINGVLVTAYNLIGNPVGSATSAADGSYSISTIANGPYRVEFTNLPAGYEPTTHGSQNGTSTQFVTSAAGATNINFGAWFPANFATTPLNAATVSHLSGDPLQGGATASTPVVHRFSPTYSGTTPSATALATAGQVGSVWGVAWQPTANRLFVGGFVRRHSGLGPQGLGGIYVVNDPQGTPSAGNFVDLENAPFGLNLGDLPSNLARVLPITTTEYSTDTLAFAPVGKQGLGDIDLTEDEQSLWAVDLYNRALLRMNVANGVTPTRVNSYTLSSMSGLPGCTLGVLRPWALKFYNGRGYFGAVCTGENASQVNNTEQDVARGYLKSYVLSFDPSNPTAATIELTIPMTYTRGQANSNSHTYNSQWFAWTDTWNYGLWTNGNATQSLPPLNSERESSRPSQIL